MASGLVALSAGGPVGPGGRCTVSTVGFHGSAAGALASAPPAATARGAPGGTAKPWSGPHPPAVAGTSPLNEYVAVAAVAAPLSTTTEIAASAPAAATCHRFMFPPAFSSWTTS